MIRFAFTVSLSPVVFCTVSYAAASTAATVFACLGHFAAVIARVVTNPELQPRTRAMFLDAYAVLHSEVRRTPLYAAERVTGDYLPADSKLSPQDSFHAQDALPSGERAEPSDYARSGYDRRPPAPNGDVHTRRVQARSFSLVKFCQSGELGS